MVAFCPSTFRFSQNSFSRPLSDWLFGLTQSLLVDLGARYVGLGEARWLLFYFLYPRPERQCLRGHSQDAKAEPQGIRVPVQYLPPPLPSHPSPPVACFSLLPRIRSPESLSTNFTDTRSHTRQCHRRKLRCDKRQPCSRCVQAGSPEDCTYQSLPSESKKTPSVEPSEDLCHSLSDSFSSSEILPSVPIAIKPFHRANDGRARISGTTHWSTIASEVCMTGSR